METYYLIIGENKIELARSMFGQNMGSHVLTLKVFNKETKEFSENDSKDDLSYISHEEDFFGSINNNDRLKEFNSYEEANSAFISEIN